MKSQFLSSIKEIKKEYIKEISKEKNRFIENCFKRKKDNLIRPFVHELRRDKFGIIAEIKMASPSKGDISRYTVSQLAGIYEECKVNCISVLTEEKYFKGHIDNIKKTKTFFSGPVLMKDFIFSEIQIYEGVSKGADAVLLIAALLSKNEITDFYNICTELSVSALIEIHTENDLEKLDLIENIDLIGVNARDLSTLEINKKQFKNLFSELPEKTVKVAESSIESSMELIELKSIGYNAALIGSSIVESDDPAGFIMGLKNDCN